MNVFFAIIGGGFFAAVSAMFGPMLLEKIKHKHKKEDEAECAASQIDDVRNDIRDYQEETTAQFDSLKEITEKSIQELKEVTEGRMNDFEDRLEENRYLTDSLVKNEVARTYINIRKDALYAIKKGKITAKKKEYLLHEYERYKRLPSSNGFLEDTMETMKSLGVIVEDDDIE